MKVYILTSALFVAGCGDSSSKSPSQSPKAMVDLTVYKATYVTSVYSSQAKIRFDFGLMETAGTGIDLNRIRLYISRRDGEIVEKRGISQRRILDNYGTNRIDGHGAFHKMVTFGVESSIPNGDGGWFLRLEAA